MINNNLFCIYINKERDNSEIDHKSFNINTYILRLNIDL